MSFYSLSSWASEAVFYHIYPLGLCGAPAQNDFTSPAMPRLEAVHNWVKHLKHLGCNALYLGPVFESGTHGYDTTDYFTVDRRLGTNATLQKLTAELHANGIRVILDGVFNHVGRDFWAFRDLLAKGQDSPYRDWFSGVDFSRSGPYGDKFAYDGWNGHYNLVKLNLHHAEVRAHLFAAIQQWVEEFHIDGLRLDAADVMDLAFLRDMASFCRGLRADFWLLGEVIHGDYRRWANADTLDATTNYECYKGLYSSHNDKNYFELAYSLNRLFGEHGIYKHLNLYSFADNHDVNRIASTLQNPAHLYPLHVLLFTMPGVPSVYYGSEWGIRGTKLPGSDAPLRPKLISPEAVGQAPHPALPDTISRLAKIRKEHAALRYGSYQQVHVAHEQLAFARRTEQEYLVIVVNAASSPARLSLKVDVPDGHTLIDLLEPQQQFTVQNGQVHVGEVPACWARILQVQ
ncbi:glycosidase [Pontibacter ummariensis]|uniref:Glycosidase n=1 Tax=Pontibacter ummariensis TaxID=1610492 RepID=A0A239GYP0_9BACT|nr:alpha-amylase family glycosyl hydrolase [Pontibacter ummariensis]PRY10970.1 glycosidase [Pontibacter ummariensis]SNS74031.1 Glycosidase [Pontibacter ummariensis]